MVKTPLLIVRADANVEMGTGHVMRCLALAHAWQAAGGEVVFAIAEATPSVEARLSSEGVAITRLRVLPNSVQDVKALTELARARGADWVIVDGYQFDNRFQMRIRDCGLKLLLVDDLGQCGEYSADFVLDQNVLATEQMYANRRAHTQLLLGPRYAMLRCEFQGWRGWRREIPRFGSKLLFTMGGSDPGNLTLRLIEALPGLRDLGLEITVVAGGSNPQLAELQRAVHRLGVLVELAGSVMDMPALMAQSDIAVICSGGTTWELLYMGCATLSYFRNPVQGKIVSELDARGTLKSLGAAENFEADRLTAIVKEIAASQERRAKMAQLGRELVDGQGPERVLRHLLPTLSRISA